MDTAPRAEAQIRKLLQSRKAVAAGRLQIISMEKIKEHVEGDWDSFAGLVRATITETIMKRLGPEDSFAQTGDDAYLIVFANLGKDEAELECVLIMQEALRALFGDRRLDDQVDVRTAAIGVDGRVDVEEVDLLDVIGKLLNKEQAGSRPGMISRSDESLEVFSDASGKSRGSIALDRLARDMPPGLHFHYRPAWDIRRKALSLYSCVPADNRCEGYGVLGEKPDPYMVAALDFLALGRVTHEMKRLHQSGARLLISCPVHLDTLADLGVWKTYHILCERISSDLFRRDLVFEIFGAEEADQARLVYCASKIRKYCRHIIIRTKLGGVPFRKFDSGSIDYLCAEVGNPRGSEKRQMKLMDDYAAKAQRMELLAMATDLGTLSQVTAAIGSGFVRVAGDAVHPPITRPEFIFRFEARNLLDRLTPGGEANEAV